MSNPAIAKCRENLLSRGMDIGDPVTEEFTDSNGVVTQGYNDGVMWTSPGIGEAWFLVDVRSPLGVPQS